jgi:selenocysteine-specific elongation factor
VILGTAGHIDHGKTALVKALTGVDTDRLPEEQRRGITIELGFAPLVLDGLGTIGVVDVPGHEAFVRTMLAGASGIDLALLVVAADEGVMPQTREHLAILDLLGIRSGVIALTKTDLVDQEWLALVVEDVMAAVAGSGLEGAAIVPVSSVTGAGLEALRAAIVAAGSTVPRRDARDLFRLPVDRVFSVKGTGTVVTGTVWTGQLRRDEIVRVLPGGQAARVRGLQSHGASVDVGEPGSRLAINLGGVNVADVPRGSTIVSDATWEPIDVLRADVSILPAAPSLGPRTRLRFHLGTREVGARLVGLGSRHGAGSRQTDAPGTTRDRNQGGRGATPVRLVLEEPVAARGGDRFVLRMGSPLATIGGGVVTDGAPAHRRAKPWPVADLPPIERVVAMVSEAGVRGVACDLLPLRLGLRPPSVAAMAAAAVDRTALFGGVLYDRDAIAHEKERLIRVIDAHHARAPLEEGVSLQSLRSGGHTPLVLSDELIRQLVEARTIVVERGTVRRAGWLVRPSASQQAALDNLTRQIAVAGREPPSTSELASAGVVVEGTDVTTLLRLLDRQGTLRQVEPDRFYSVEALSGMTDALRANMTGGREYSPAELRELLGVSRKYLIPLLEYYDRTGVTERRANGRVLVPQRTAGPAATRPDVTDAARAT